MFSRFIRPLGVVLAIIGGGVSVLWVPLCFEVLWSTTPLDVHNLGITTIWGGGALVTFFVGLILILRDQSHEQIAKLMQERDKFQVERDSFRAHLIHLLADMVTMEFMIWSEPNLRKRGSSAQFVREHLDSDISSACRRVPQGVVRNLILFIRCVPTQGKMTKAGDEHFLEFARFLEEQMKARRAEDEKPRTTKMYHNCVHCGASHEA